MNCLLNKEEIYGRRKQLVIKSAKQEVAAAISNTTIADSILSSFNKLVTQDQLRFPQGYALGNQLKLDVSLADAK